jgi:hypothetical protein
MIIGDYSGAFLALILSILGVVVVGYAIGLAVWYGHYRVAEPEPKLEQQTASEDVLEVA